MGLRQYQSEVREYFSGEKVVTISSYLYAKNNFSVDLNLDTQIINNVKRDIRKEMIKGYMSMLSTN